MYFRSEFKSGMDRPVATPNGNVSSLTVRLGCINTSARANIRLTTDRLLVVKILTFKVFERLLMMNSSLVASLYAISWFTRRLKMINIKLCHKLCLKD